MARSECDYCKRDISKPSLVRCSSQRCPLKASRGGAVRGIMAGLGGIAIIAALIGIGAAWLLSPSSRSQASSGNDQGESAPDGPRATALELGGNVRTWAGGLFSSGKGSGADSASAQPQADPGMPDPRAAARVQTFSCSGSLTASRSLICTNWDLATTDYNLALTYSSVLAHSRHPDALRRAHDQWLAGLDTLGNDVEKLREYYQKWQERLARG